MSPSCLLEVAEKVAIGVNPGIGCTDLCIPRPLFSSLFPCPEHSGPALSHEFAHVAVQLPYAQPSQLMGGICYVPAINPSKAMRGTIRAVTSP